VKKQWLVMVFFGLFWSTLTLVFDGILGYSFVNQIRASHFASTTGVITHSETTTEHGSHGSTTGVDIRYHYEVNGRPFEGTRYRYLEGSSSDSKWAKDAVRRYSMGAEAPVFYNPKNPSESLLSPGLDGSDFMWIIFLTPFTLIMLGLWMGGIGFMRNKFFHSTNGHVRTIQDGHFLRIRLPRLPAWGFGMAATGAIAFLETFVLVFGGGGFHPKAEYALAALIIAFGAGIVITVWRGMKARSGLFDLAIDERDGSFELPLTFGRKTRIPISFANVMDVIVDTVPDKRNTPAYVATVVLCDQKASDGKIAEWFNKTDAENFVAWLRPLLKVSGNDKKSTALKSTMPVPDHGKDIS
jgi:Protein of unknown function (DUF3592)